MSRLLTALRWEAVLQARQQFYALTAVVALVWVAFFQLLPDAARADPALLAPAFVLTNFQVTAFYFVAALVLLEKGQGVVHALFVTPLRPSEYLLAKALSLAALAAAENGLIVGLVFGRAVAWGWLLPGMAAMGVVYALLGLVAVARFEAINTFLMPSVGYLTLLTLPLLGYYGILPWWAFAPHPLMPSLVLVEAACRPVGGGMVLYGMAGSVAWLFLAFAWARRRLLRHVVSSTV